MDRPGRLVLFADVVDCGGFRRAAALRESTASVVSRQIDRLEGELGIALFNRSTRGLTLTEGGRALYPHAGRVRESMRASEQIGEHFREGVRGLLRISAARHLGRRQLLPVIEAFRARYPEVRVDLQLADRHVDLVGEGFDVAIRVTRPEDSTLACRRLADTPLVVAASPDLIERFGAPASMDALADYPAVAYRGEQVSIDYWRYWGPDGTMATVGVQPVLTLNDGDAVIDAAVRGLGVALLARYSIARELANGELVDALPGARLVPFAPVYALFPSGPHLPAKTRAFIDLLVERPDLAGWNAEAPLTTQT